MFAYYDYGDLKLFIIYRGPEMGGGPVGEGQNNSGF